MLYGVGVYPHRKQRFLLSEFHVKLLPKLHIPGFIPTLQGWGIYRDLEHLRNREFLEEFNHFHLRKWITVIPQFNPHGFSTFPAQPVHSSWVTFCYQRSRVWAGNPQLVTPLALLLKLRNVNRRFKSYSFYNRHRTSKGVLKPTNLFYFHFTHILQSEVRPAKCRLAFGCVIMLTMGSDPSKRSAQFADFTSHCTSSPASAGLALSHIQRIRH